MSIKRIILTVMLVAFAAILLDGKPLWAGYEGGEAPNWDNVTGPELWSVNVLHCESTNDSFASMRVKRVRDCAVQTQALYDYIDNSACATNSTDYLYLRFDPNPFFTQDPDIPANGVAIITKVKNFQVVVEELSPTVTRTTVSFDAQIKFEVPASNP